MKHTINPPYNAIKVSDGFDEGIVRLGQEFTMQLKVAKSFPFRKAIAGMIV